FLAAQRNAVLGRSGIMSTSWGSTAKIVTTRKLCPPEAYPGNKRHFALEYTHWIHEVIAMTSAAFCLSMGMLYHSWVPHEETVFNKKNPYGWMGADPVSEKKDR